MGEGSEPLEANALIAAAADNGHAISPRMLQRWRGQGLLPRGCRASGGPAIWLYPPSSRQQLVRLLHWRSRTRSFRGILLALWVEGFPIDLSRVRTALPHFIDDWELIQREIMQAGNGNETAAADALGAEMARMRSNAPVPRRARMSEAERARAYAYLTANLLGSENEVRSRDSDLAALERLLGLRTGRGGGLSGTLGLRDEDGKADRLPAPAQARSAIAEARDEEFELARRGVWILVTLVPSIVKGLLAGEGPKAVDFIDVIDHLFADPQADGIALLVAALLVSLRSHQPDVDELRDHIAALAPVKVGPELAALAGVDLRALATGSA
jgi:hypothetical protein